MSTENTLSVADLARENVRNLGYRISLPAVWAVTAMSG